MSNLLGELLALFEIDQEWLQLKNQLDAGPAQIKEQEDTIAGARQTRKAAEDIVKARATELDQTNLDLRAAEAELEDQQAKLKIIKNNKEYKIVTDRIKELKQTITDKEAKSLEIMEELDSLRTNLQEQLATVGTMEDELEALRAKINEDESTIRAAAAKIKPRRAAQAEKVKVLDPQVLDIYMNALRRGRGIAMAAIENGICQICYRQANPNTANAARLGKEPRKAVCEGCGRILYDPNSVVTESS